MYLSPMCEISNTHYLKKFLNKLKQISRRYVSNLT